MPNRTTPDWLVTVVSQPTELARTPVSSVQWDWMHKPIVKADHDRPSRKRIGASQESEYLVKRDRMMMTRDQFHLAFEAARRANDPNADRITVEIGIVPHGMIAQDRHAHTNHSPSQPQNATLTQRRLEPPLGCWEYRRSCHGRGDSQGDSVKSSRSSYVTRKSMNARLTARLLISPPQPMATNRSERDSAGSSVGATTPPPRSNAHPPRVAPYRVRRGSWVRRDASKVVPTL